MQAIDGSIKLTPRSNHRVKHSPEVIVKNRSLDRQHFVNPLSKGIVSFDKPLYKINILAQLIRQIQ